MFLLLLFESGIHFFLKPIINRELLLSRFLLSQLFVRVSEAVVGVKMGGVHFEGVAERLLGFPVLFAVIVNPPTP